MKICKAISNVQKRDSRRHFYFLSDSFTAVNQRLRVRLVMISTLL